MVLALRHDPTAASRFHLKGLGLKFPIRYFGIGPVLAGVILAAALTALLWPMLRTHENYPDPVTGAVVWNDIDKGRDMRSLIVLIASTGIAVTGISALCWTLAPAGSDDDPGRTLNQFLLLSLAPAAWRLSAAAFSSTNRFPPLAVLSLYPLGAVVALLMLRRYRDTVVSSDICIIGGSLLIAPFMAAFSCLAILLTTARIMPGLIPRIMPLVVPATVAFTVIAALAIFSAFLFSDGLGAFGNRSLHILTLCQYPLPLLLFYLIPPPLLDLSHQFHVAIPRGLAITLGLLAALGAFLQHRRFQRAATHADHTVARFISPISVAALAIFIFCPTADAPSISPDFFHTGEQLIPWQQIWNFHRVPYVDFVPIHGLMAIARGGLNQLFFDGSAANYSAAAVLLLGFAAAILALTACELVSPLGALLFLFTALPDLDRMYFLAPPLLLIASPRLLKKPVLWLTLWIILCPLLCAYNAAMGPAFVLGTIPIALWQTWRSIGSVRWRLLLLFSIALLSAAVVLLVPLSRSITFGYIRFILDNQWTNEAINGIAWSQGLWRRDRTIGIGSSQLLWECFRFGWIPAVFAAAVVYWREWTKSPGSRNLPLMVLSAAVPLVLLFSCPWVMERIDPGAPSRSGALAQVALLGLVPALTLLAIPRQHLGISVLLLASFLGILYPYGIPTGLDADLLVQKPFSRRFIPADARAFDGQSAGLPRIGRIIRPTPDFTSDIVNLKNDLARWLKPGETFLDLSNQTALYFYLDMPMPAPYAGYVAGNSRLQGVMMRQLGAHPAPVVLISPCGWLDAAPPSLRCYRPYRDYILKFPAVEKDGFVFLVDPARVSNLQPVGCENQLRLLDRLYRREDLQRLPIAWGESWDSLRDRFASVAKLPSAVTMSQFAQTFRWKLLPESAVGSNADFLRFHFDCVPTDGAAFRRATHCDSQLPPDAPEPRLRLSWTNPDNSESAPIRFRAHPGDLLVPLGAYPRWLLGRGFRSLNVQIENPDCVKEMSLTEAELLRLIPL